MNQQFDILVYYEDTHLHKAINSSTLTINITDQEKQSTTKTNGMVDYNVISVDCNELTSTESKHVDITATKDYCTTETVDYTFVVYGGSTSTIKTQPTILFSTTTTATKKSPGVGLIFLLYAIAAIDRQE